MPTATEPVLTRAAEARLRKPRTRGAFRPLDAARRQLGLLQASDGLGQAHAAWLVDLASGTVEDARFLAFGSRWSHPAADAFTELARGMTVAEACLIAADRVEAMLRDTPATPACDPGPGGPLAFLPDLQARLLAALPEVRLLPKPAEKQVYQRKRKQDWNETDQKWLPLSLLKKIAAVDAAAKRVLAERAPGAGHRVEGLHDDFRVVLIISGIADEQRPTLGMLIDDALHGIHPDLHAELAQP